jgi:SPP1 family predicted phage head-tail adaptor
MRQRTGLANRRALLQSVVETADSEGFVAEAWSTVRSIWAHIAPLGAAEMFQAGQTQEDVTHTVTVRYARDLNPKMRLLYGTRVFFIHNVLDEDEAHEWVTMLCKEIVGGGGIPLAPSGATGSGTYGGLTYSGKGQRP